MLRWLIAILFLANLIAFGLASGMLGPLPAAGAREAHHLERQVHPEWLKARPISEAQAAEQVIVGQPDPTPTISSAPLGG
ncbi:hypothetical protein [Trinickia dinghuensis]|uniref:Uncharacterized protein n=1 Tax=Trinickia dinghuensis TaxID=2291023 RepID=A0A3D8K508_9BURK|nr:hypothetical protein [Trinickia dinghuensis]RDU99965.1 hypothetical protein DWV00_06140 [Trinickia dinghuensis]